MQKHTKIYMDFFDYGQDDFIPSELDNDVRANDIHHIDNRGMGGSDEKDYIENLMALSREEHDQFGDKKQYMVYLYRRHIAFIQNCRPDYQIQLDRIPSIYLNEIIKITDRL